MVFFVFLKMSNKQMKREKNATYSFVVVVVKVKSTLVYVFFDINKTKK